MAKDVQRLEDITTWRLCLGCGACAAICPEKKVRLVDFLKDGIRPVFDDPGQCGDCSLCLDICPVVATDFSPYGGYKGDAIPLGHDWGRVLEIWEGHAADPEVRFKGSSGGALSALAAYCIEVLGMNGVLHTGQDPHDPVRNSTRLSRNRKELLAAVGSRYSPASVCNGLALIENAEGPCVFIGKPVEAAAVKKAEKLKPQLAGNVGAVFSFFCAETPSTMGTIDLLKKMGVDSRKVGSLSYRGNGWPGHFEPRQNGLSNSPRMTYRESWAFLQAYRPWSAQIWPDGTGELADISCGDPWYSQPDGKNPGSSLVVVRTERGREIVNGAIEAGYLELRTAEPWKLVKSQEGLVRKKGAVWGRLAMMRLFGLPTPRFKGGGLFRCWLDLPLEEKLRSLFGTARRIISRRLYLPSTLDALGAKPVKSAATGLQEVT